MKKIIFICLALCCLISQAYALSGKIMNNRYTYQDFSIAIPSTHIYKVDDVVEKELLMLFFSSKNHLLSNNIYLIDVFHYQKNKHLQVNNIYKNLAEINQHVWEKTFNQSLTFKQTCSYKKILGVKAHECRGKTTIDSASGDTLATSLIFPDKKILINMYALKPATTAGWAEYNKLLNSIKIK